MKTLQPGIYPDIAPEHYHSDPCAMPSLSSSIAGILIGQSPKHAWLAHPKLGGKSWAPSATMDRGSLVHTILLGKGREIVLIEADDFRTKKAKEERDFARANGAIPVLRDDLVAANDAAQWTRAEFERLKIRLDGDSEVTVVWVEHADDGTPVTCRGQLDHFVESRAMIYDLKCTGDGEPQACRRRFVSMGYHIQRAAYVSAISKALPQLAGRVEFEFLFCEMTDPYPVTPIACGGSMRELGHRQWRRAVNMWAKCLRENHWPSYAESTIYIEAAPYEMTRELENEEVEPYRLPPTKPREPEQESYSNDSLF